MSGLLARQPVGRLHPRFRPYRSWCAADPMTDSLQPKRCARLLRVLADPDRLRIIRLLRGGPRKVSEVASALELQVVNASHHLGVLRRAGLLQDERQGRFVVYQLAPDVLQPNAAVEYLDLGCCRLEMPKS
jgi:ArsR family transcriptional regulator, nickel/cobalt-responsive transcriptional repressor